MSTFFCPGRTELAGSHTDHQKGRVMAAAIDRGITADAEPNTDGIIRVYSSGFDPIEISPDRLWPNENEIGTSSALVRGIAATLQDAGLQLNGFDAHIISDLKAGHGFTMSAAFTVLIGYIIAHYADGDAVPPEVLAQYAQKAAKRWYGNLGVYTDYLASALGGGIYYDFQEDRLTRIDCDFYSAGLVLCLTDTGSFRDASVDALAAIPEDMTSVARLFGEEQLASVRRADFDAQWPEHMGETAWQRARYCMDEMPRVALMADALGLHDGERYIQLMNESGRSSEQLLQNILSPGCGDALADGLSLSAQLLKGVGAWRVHGPGFGGTIQALMPEDIFPAYQAAMNEHFGEDACQRIYMRSTGVTEL